MEVAAGPREIPQGYLGKGVRLLRELGPIGLAKRISRRLARTVVQAGSVTFFVRDTLGDISPAVPPGFEIRQLWPSDKEALLHGSESNWETLLARFQSGDLCFGALDQEGRAVHTRWVTLESARIPELQMSFVPESGTAYFYDGFTRPDARGHGIDAAVRAAIFAALRDRGRTRVYSYVRDDNPAGLRAAGRCQQRVATVRYASLLAVKPIVFQVDPKLGSALVRTPAPGGDEARNRAADWKVWFEGWLKEPLAKRSIGFHELPEDAFKAMAHHIGATLGLDPSRDTVLDLGCDSALVTRHVAPSCARLVGVDFIPGMLVDAKRARAHAGGAQEGARFAAADGRALPFPPQTFAKAYCTGVIHTLPTHEDGLKMIFELIRVSKPGGLVLVAAVPDLRKRGRARRAAWRVGGPGERARIAAAMLLPAGVKRMARRVVPWLPKAPLLYLDYDLHEVRTLLEGRGLGCAVLDYPTDFWSRDFRETRSNLLIRVP